MSKRGGAPLSRATPKKHWVEALFGIILGDGPGVAELATEEEVMAIPSPDGYRVTKLREVQLPHGWYTVQSNDHPEYTWEFCWGPEAEHTTVVDDGYHKWTDAISLLVLRFVVHPISLVTCSQVCKRWRRIVLDPRLMMGTWCAAFRRFGPQLLTSFRTSSRPTVCCSISDMARRICGVYDVSAAFGRTPTGLDWYLSVLLRQAPIDAVDPEIDEKLFVPAAKAIHDVSAMYRHQRDMSWAKVHRWSHNRVLVWTGSASTMHLVTYQGKPPYTDPTTSTAEVLVINSDLTRRVCYGERLAMFEKSVATPTFDAESRKWDVWYCPRQEALQHIVDSVIEAHQSGREHEFTSRRITNVDSEELVAHLLGDATQPLSLSALDWIKNHRRDTTIHDSAVWEGVLARSRELEILNKV